MWHMCRQCFADVPGQLPDESFKTNGALCERCKREDKSNGLVTTTDVPEQGTSDEDDSDEAALSELGNW